MTNYSRRVRENILPLSVASALPEAFEEWSFTERTEDHGEPVETCQLCDHEEVRYHFEIRNTFTKKTLWVGSQCILKFGLSVFEDGRRLSTQDARRKLDRLMQQMRLASCLKALRAVAAAEGNDILSNALTYYEEHKYLTPKQAFVVLWRLRENGIDHSPSFFKISLRREKYKGDLRTMPVGRVHTIWPALSATQRNLARSFGHTPPPE